MRKVCHDWPLDSHQAAVAAEFIAMPPPSAKEQQAYERGWQNVLEYDDLKAKAVPLDKRGRRELVRELHRLSHKIVRGSKQAAAAARAEIHRAALRYLRHGGGVDQFNISHFVAYVQSRPATRRLYRKSGKSRALGDHAIRAILKGRVAIVGKPGRNPKVL